MEIFATTPFQAVELAFVVVGFALMLVSRKRLKSGALRTLSLSFAGNRDVYETGGYRLNLVGTSLLWIGTLMYLLASLVR